MKFVADLVIERVFTDTKPDEDLAGALEKAYPFGNSKQGRQIWLDAILRHATGRRIDFSGFADDKSDVVSTPVGQAHRTAK